MDRGNLQDRIEEIRHLLSHLQGEIKHFDAVYSEVLSVLRSLKTKSDRDDLTGLMRRNAFFEKWDQLRGQALGLSQECSVLLIDIDHFKQINDQKGHAEGDATLQRVAQLLLKFEDTGCAIGRLGGEEFALVFRNDTSADQSVALAERLRSEIQNHAGCTVSIGLTVGHDPHQDLAEADRCLYEAKRSGRNRVVQSIATLKKLA